MKLVSTHIRLDNEDEADNRIDLFFIPSDAGNCYNSVAGVMIRVKEKEKVLKILKICSDEYEVIKQEKKSEESNEA